MDVLTLLIVAILLGEYALSLAVKLLDQRHAAPELPAEFRDVWDAEDYRRSQAYGRDRTRLSVLSNTAMLVATLAVIFGGGLNAADMLARGWFAGEILRGLAFWTILVVGLSVVSLPFSVYGTFVIEARYGFNRTTPGQYLRDLALAAVLAALLGYPALAGAIWLFQVAGDWAWLWVCGALVLYQLVLSFLAPALIMPLFNRFDPLAEGELRTAIEDYAARESFPLGGIYTMDGSKRSSKSNAFFTGFGRFRRIVLFDTLVERHTTGELLAVLAHEMGHFKRGHIRKLFVAGVLVNLLVFYLLSLLIDQPAVAAAFRMEQVSIYASFVFVMVFFTPLSLLLGAIMNALSRRFEYEADRYAADTVAAGADHLIAGLKRLSVDNLANLTPHPLGVWLHYSHPPLLARIGALRQRD